jgi:hypothetical protein
MKRRKQPKKNTLGTPREVPDDVREKQDPAYDGDAFEDALKRVSRRLDDPSEPDPGSPKKEA